MLCFGGFQPELVFLIPENAVFLHLGKLTAHGAPVYAQIVRQLLPVIGNRKRPASGTFAAIRKIGQQSATNRLGTGMEDSAGELEVLFGADGEQIAEQLDVKRTRIGTGIPDARR